MGLIKLGISVATEGLGGMLRREREREICQGRKVAHVTQAKNTHCEEKFGPETMSPVQNFRNYNKCL